MPCRALDARIDLYTPAGALRASVTSNLRRIEIQETATDEADDAGFELAHDFADLDDFVVGDECRVYVRLESDAALRHVWTGVIDSIRSDRKGPAFAELPVKAQDYVYWTLANTYVTDAYEDMAAGAIVRHILDTYVPSIGSAEVEDTSTTVPSIVFDGESALSCIRRLAQFANATFYGDKDKALHFFETASVDSGSSVGTADVVRESFTVETSMAGFGNVATVKGGNRKVQDGTGPTTFSSFTSLTGIVRKTARIFFTKSKVARVEVWTDPTGFPGTLTVRLQADNAAGTAPVNASDPEFDLASATLDAADLAVAGWTAFDLPDHTVAPGSYVWVIVESDEDSQRVGLDASSDLMWRSYFDFPVIVQRVDVASISRYGRHELQPVIDGSIATEEEADQLAARVLAEHKDPTVEGSYELADAMEIDLRDELVGHWRFDETSGSTAADSSGNGRTGTIVGGVTLGAAGQVGTCFDFDGSTGYVSVADHADLDITGGVTIAAWIKPNAGAVTSGVINKRAGSGGVNGSGYEMLITSAGLLRIETGDGVNLHNTTSPAAVTRDGATWTFCVVTWAASGTAVFINGVQVAIGSGGAQIGTNAATLYLGARAGATNPFSGSIDNPMVLDRPLTATEVAWLYQAGAAMHNLASAEVGSTVSATFPLDAVAAGPDVVLQRKRRTIVADEGVHTLRHEFVSAARTRAVQDVMRSFHDRIKRLEDKGAGKTVVALVAAFGEELAVSDALAAVENDPELVDAVVDEAEVDTDRVYPG